MKFTILQQDGYPQYENEHGHLQFVQNNEDTKLYITPWGTFGYQSEERILLKKSNGVINNFRYDYDDKTNT